MGDDATAVAAYVDASAAVLDMPLGAQHRDGVILAMRLLAAFAADVAAVELPEEIEVAGVFVP
jgi:hypothetical protein